MKNFIRFLLVGCLGGISTLVSAGTARAQYYNPYAAYYQTQLQQQMWSAQVAQANYMARAATPAYQAAQLDPYSGVASQAAQAYGVPGAYDQGYANPFNPFLYNNSPGATLMGQADVMRSLGKVVNDQEEARIKRELANQARLDTVKKEFDLRMYIKANTPTYTQEQERVAKTTLRRIQTNSLPGEVSNGKSLNYLLDDLKRNAGKKTSLEPIQLSEGVLMNLNVTKKELGIGILRDGGTVSFPTALREIMKTDKRAWFNTQLQDLVKQGSKDEGRIDPNLFTDVRREMDKVRDELVAKVNEIPTAQYLDAKRFLHEFTDATTALERGEAKVQQNFRRFIEGGKTVQEIVEYMRDNGLRFAPATAADEAAYRAVHGGLASLSVALSSNLGVDAKD